MSEKPVKKGKNFNDPAIAREYNKHGNVVEYGKKTAQYVCDHEPNIQDFTILDFGCGTGCVGLPLLDHAKKVIFLDPSEAMLDILKEGLNGRTNYEIVHGTLDAFQCTENQLDVVTASLVLHHLDVAWCSEMLQRLCKMLKPGGRIYTQEFMPDTRPGWDEASAQEVFGGAGFVNIKYIPDWGNMPMPPGPNGEDVFNRLCFMTAEKPQ